MLAGELLASASATTFLAPCSRSPAGHTISVAACALLRGRLTSTREGIQVSATVLMTTWASFQSSRHRMSAPLHDTEGKYHSFSTFTSLHAHLSPWRQACCCWYREHAEELERAWWNEQAELSSGPDAAGKVPEDQATSTEWQV